MLVSLKQILASLKWTKDHCTTGMKPEDYIQNLLLVNGNKIINTED